MSIGLLFLILAAISFFLGAFNVARPPINWLCLGLAFVVCLWLFTGTITRLG